MPKSVSHVVTRPGRTPSDAPVEIPVADELATEPGVPKRPADVSFYSREQPLESQTIENSADREWAWTVYSDEFANFRKGHNSRMKPLVEAAAVSGDIEPNGLPVAGDVTKAIRDKAREMGFGEVGFTLFDRKYVFASKKSWVKFEHALCLAYEQDYESTQSLPSMAAEHAHYGTYEVETALALELASFINILGYRAQVHAPTDNSCVFIPMFVAAGLGQLGANGQLLSPHFGSRARLLIISTDALVTHDQPVDYGIHRYCDTCQVCVNRCPGRALEKEKVVYRGVEKNKLVYERCRPIMLKYDGCGVCMKVCPVQRYGMKPVMEHYVETGQVLGKGTENLEGYSLEGKGHFGPGELPHFDQSTFKFPHGTQEQWLFEQFKSALERDGVPDAEEAQRFASNVKTVMDAGDPGWDTE